MHESSAREYVSGARELCMRVVHESGAREWCTRERLHGLVSKQPAVSSLACVREVEANFSPLGMEPPGQTLVDWAWEPPGQTLVDWAWALQGKQAVEKSRLVEEEMLSKQESR